MTSFPIHPLSSIHTPHLPFSHKQEENYFFRLSAYQKQLEELLATRPDFIQPSFRANEVKSWVESGVPDFSISRATIKWGIPVPADESQVIYVWFDALLGYISALVKEDDAYTIESSMRRGWPCDLHIIGKDILRFHAVYWPAMLMSAGVPLPNRIYSHGFLTKDGLKMGKSLGNVLEPEELVDKVRYPSTGDTIGVLLLLVISSPLCRAVRCGCRALVLHQGPRLRRRWRL